jgi:hypothetical protein
MTVIKSLSVLFYVCVGLTAFVPSTKGQGPIDGKYYWESGPDEKVEKYVDLAIMTAGDNVVISVDLVWSPGAHVEIGGTARSADIRTEPGPGGNITYQLIFTLTDGFNNEGVGHLIVSGDTCVITFTPTEEVDSRATRQYGEYTLIRQAMNSQ